MSDIYDTVAELARVDAVKVAERDKTYGSSWKQRGGQGAYFVTVRKSDRIENMVKKYGYDIFEAIRQNPAADGIVDDIRDLRRYLLLIEAEMVGQGSVIPDTAVAPTSTLLTPPASNGIPTITLNEHEDGA